MKEYEPVIGLEVHLHLNTKSKAFCSCSTVFGAEPNTQTCPVCLGLPGSLPVVNIKMIEYAIRVAIALNCAIQKFTKFDRKNYFYPDLPKNYQISQYDLPISTGGYLEIGSGESLKRVGITRVHMEEDAGKLIHQDQNSAVDYNRAGVPLLEIVSEPEISSPEEAYSYLNCLKSLIEYLDVSDCDMEKGSLRCDANISLRPKGEKKLGIKTELKNMNSFKGVKDALSYEIKRQSALLESGEELMQETRLWDQKEMKTFAMRTKEGAKDYRYFPEPDLLPFVIEDGFVNRIKETVPELPLQKATRFTKDYGILENEARILVASKNDSFFIEECLKSYCQDNKRGIVNWIIGPLLSEANQRNLPLSGLGVSSEKLLELVFLTEKGQISNLTAKAVLSDMINTGKSAEEIVTEKNLRQVSDHSQLDKIANEVIAENQKSVNDYKSGKENALMFLVGQLMRKSQGKADPKAAKNILKEKLDA